GFSFCISKLKSWVVTVAAGEKEFLSFLLFPSFPFSCKAFVEGRSGYFAGVEFHDGEQISFCNFLPNGRFLAFSLSVNSSLQIKHYVVVVIIFLVFLTLSLKLIQQLLQVWAYRKEKGVGVLSEIVMSPPLLGAGEEANQSNITLLASPASLDHNICQNISGLKEHNYMGLSDCSSVGSSTISTTSGDNNGCLNLKATELRLGLPGSQSSEGDSEFSLLCSPNLDEKPVFPLHPLKYGNYLLSHKTVGPGNKRGFSDVMEGFAEGTFLVSLEVNVILSPRPSLNSVLKSDSVKENTGTQPPKTKEVISKNTAEEKPRTGSEIVADRVGTANNNSSAPATKAQVVGWPPARSFRKNTLASTSKNA
ncbi:unnamed protein product, partial [Ilex paraguariensis]